MDEGPLNDTLLPDISVPSSTKHPASASKSVKQMPRDSVEAVADRLQKEQERLNRMKKKEMKRREEEARQRELRLKELDDLLARAEEQRVLASHRLKKPIPVAKLSQPPVKPAAQNNPKTVNTPRIQPEIKQADTGTTPDKEGTPEKQHTQGRKPKTVAPLQKSQWSPTRKPVPERSEKSPRSTSQPADTTERSDEEDDHRGILLALRSKARVKKEIERRKREEEERHVREEMERQEREERLASEARELEELRRNAARRSAERHQREKEAQEAAKAERASVERQARERQKAYWSPRKIAELKAADHREHRKSPRPSRQAKPTSEDLDNHLAKTVHSLTDEDWTLEIKIFPRQSPARPGQIRRPLTKR